MDRFGATDAWLMFSLYMEANGHTGGALVSLLILGLYFVALNDGMPAKRTEQ